MLPGDASNTSHVMEDGWAVYMARSSHSYLQCNPVNARGTRLVLRPSQRVCTVIMGNSLKDFSRKSDEEGQRFILRE